MNAGAAIYRDECSACHTQRGDGVNGLFPGARRLGGDALQRCGLVDARRPRRDPQRRHERAPTGPAMPGFGWLLDDGEVADVLTYMRNAGATPPMP